MRPQTSLQDRFYAGERAALARVLSYIEDDPNLANTWIADLPPVSDSRVIGVTGPPGAGKSTLVSSLIRAYRDEGKTVGVLAFDPSSRTTGGAALGDRIRMNETWDDEGVYIRSLANRGRLGGLSDAVFGALRAFDAYGIDITLVETVGVGQGEIDIAEVADVTLLIQVPGTGDTIQLLKAGVLEIADVLIVNKSDLPGASELLRDLRSLVTQVSPSMSSTAVVPATATTAEGVAAVLEAIEARLTQHPKQRRRRAEAELRHYVLSTLERRTERFLASSDGLEIVEAVACGSLSAWAARERLMREID